MNMKNKNKEVNLKYLGWLLESAVSSVLLEQAEQQVPPVAPAQPPVQTAQPPMPGAEQPPADPTQQTPQSSMSLDDLIEKLNLIRGGRSFTDPEVYTKMGEVFKTFTDQQKTELDASLTKVIDVIVNPDEGQLAQPGNAPQTPTSQTPQTPTSAPAPQPAPTQQTPII